MMQDGSVDTLRCDVQNYDQIGRDQIILEAINIGK